MKKNNSLKVFIVAGEESGDLHASKLIQNIKKYNQQIEFYGHGGDKMKQEGVQIIEHINKLAIVGFFEVIKHLPYMMSVMGKTISWIKENKPARVILVDYPGFNLRLARELKKLGVPVTYFILPQVWAWKEKRVSILRHSVDQCLSIIPFEQEWFEERNVQTSFIGHPFIELEHPNSSLDFYRKHSLNPNDKILSIFPGSRQQEVKQHLSILISTIERIMLKIPDLKIILGKAPGVNIDNTPSYIKIESDNPQLALENGTAALVASGTATLESAVLDIPIVVFYRFSNLTWLLAKRLSNVKFACIVNLIANKMIVPEFIQNDMTVNNLSNAIIPLLNDTSSRKNILLGYNQIRRTLGIPGVYDRGAQEIIKRLTI
jgi:lipid-A-disaccharide synthase|tara:strand:+ start:90 stop:1214 length:1125 start_codon:yes stop_codon:yes gene_type:complete